MEPTNTEALTVSTPAAATGADLGWPNIKAGMQVRVHQRIKEVNAKGEEKERTQIFEGLVIGRRGGTTAGATMTVRKQSFGVWVEKILPVHLPEISNIEVVKTYRTRRAKLSFVRNPRGRRLKEVKK
ncbi:50S ribosomal protein L19 [Candidatus Uhrbacteria bacterium]|nr:50S ribosomal protein L19 [Candidatus Uhrbacteria bacterium]